MMTRFPRPGLTKTRLIPVLGPEGAALLQRQMTEHLLARFQNYCCAYSLILEVHFTEGTRTQMLDWLGNDISYQQQCQGDLGQRLSYAFEQGFAAELQRILIVGSDCPGIQNTHITHALIQLGTHDVVLGPANDGGYYLIGLKAPQPELFAAISWGQSCVLQQTLAIATDNGLTVALLSPLSDIDRPEDLPLWEAHLEDFTSSPQI
ncbi:MAG: TIGR04282 family arsenosugar biosynthesis glycosyltransferase [Cyanobacteria bacterium J06638_28]